jgi:hypothetical protein
MGTGQKKKKKKVSMYMEENEGCEVAKTCSFQSAHLLLLSVLHQSSVSQPNGLSHKSDLTVGWVEPGSYELLNDSITVSNIYSVWWQMNDEPEKTCMEAVVAE